MDTEEPFTSVHAEGGVLVQVVETSRRQISTGRLLERLDDRTADVVSAVRSGTMALSQALSNLDGPEDWTISEITAAFGITLAAEGSLVVSKASAAATFEVTIKYVRD